MIKQVIIIRKDLHMRKGKMCAQAAHASMMHLSNLLRSNGNISLQELPETYQEWIKESFAKIVLYVNSEEELKNICDQAEKDNIITSRIIDSGFTEFKGVPTFTCASLGPDFPEKIDKFTKDLKVL